MPPLRDEHQAEQVRVLSALAQQLARRPERAQAQRARVELAALRQPERLRARRERGSAEPRIGPAVDDALDPKRPEQRTQVAGVVGLVVADHDRRERVDPELAQPVLDAVIRRPGVDEDRLAVGRVEQDRVALADVQDPHGQVAGPVGRCEAEPNGQASGR